MKAQTFQISGDSKFLTLIMAELKELGYQINESNPTFNTIFSVFTQYYYDTSGPKKDFLRLSLTNGKIVDKGSISVSFTLPAQYTEAVAFAKEQLSSKFWSESYKIGDYIVSQYGHVHKITGENETYYFTECDMFGKRGSGSTDKTTIRKAKKKEIEEYEKSFLMQEGDIVVTNGVGLSNNELGKLTFKDSKGKWTITSPEGNTLEFVDKNSLSLPSKFSRLATSEEIKTFNKRAKENKTGTLVIGSRKATIVFDKQNITTPTGLTLSVERVKALYAKASKAEFNLGDYNATVADDVPFIRIGCIAENNLVSLNDLKTVLNAIKNL